MWQQKGKIMATAEIEKYIIKRIVLNLSEEEADYIQGMAQNYCGEYPEDETEKDKAIRESIFEAIFNAKRENN